MLRVLIILVLTGAALAACGAQQTGRPNSESTLPATSWLLASLDGQPALQGTAVTLNFDSASRLSGSDGCNQYNAEYTADGSNFSVKEPIATTEMACADEIMAQGAAYLTALGDATTYEATAEELVLSDDEGSQLATFSAQSQDLAGTSWMVIAYNNGKEAVVSVAADTALTASFGADGNLTGFAGCNDYNATYVTSGRDSIEIGPVASTRKACAEPEGVMDQEVQYLAALSTAATYKVDGDKLELRTADGALAADFVKAGQ